MEQGLTDSALVTEDTSNEAETLGRGYRTKMRSTRLRDFVGNTVHATSFYPIEDFVSCDRFSADRICFLAAITFNTIPRHYAQAVEDEHFRDAMNHEIVALEDSGTWTVVTLPTEKKALVCGWVYCIKYIADGTFERYKARLVVFGITKWKVRTTLKHSHQLRK